jgi:hypothetical protein
VTAYRCWDPDNGDEDDARVDADARDASHAAVRFVRRREERDGDYSERTTVCVRDRGGVFHAFEVHREIDVLYRAVELEAGRGAS